MATVPCIMPFFCIFEGGTEPFKGIYSHPDEPTQCCYCPEIFLAPDFVGNLLQILACGSANDHELRSGSCFVVVDQLFVNPLSLVEMGHNILCYLLFWHH